MLLWDGRPARLKRTGGTPIPQTCGSYLILIPKLYYGLNDPDYNYNIRSVPTAEQGTKYFHWYIAIIPRVTKQAGFELGSGMFINTALPEESAEFLRSTKIPNDRNLRQT